MKYLLSVLFFFLMTTTVFAQSDLMENPESEGFEAPVSDEVQGTRGFEREPGGEFSQMPAEEQEFDPAHDDVDYSTPEEEEYAEDINY